MENISIEKEFIINVNKTTDVLDIYYKINDKLKEIQEKENDSYDKHKIHISLIIQNMRD